MEMVRVPIKFAADEFVKKFGEFVKSENLSAQQVFNCDETGLFWKKCQTEPTSHKKKRHCLDTNQ
jgi:hypothetical protein